MTDSMGNEQFRDENFREEVPHGHAESAIGIFMGRLFGFRFVQQDLFTESQWVAIVEIFERFYGLNSISRAMQYRRERAEESTSRSAAEPPVAKRYTKPDPDDKYFPPEPNVQDLSNGRLSILEAAYEHLNDLNGLRRLLMFYILGDCYFYQHYLLNLRELWGVDWPVACEYMVALHQQYGPRGRRNLAYEYFLAEEQLGDAAWEYVQEIRNQQDLVDALVDHADEADENVRRLFAAASAAGHGSELAELLTAPLQDADSELLSTDTPANRLRIAVIMNLCRALLPESVVREQRERLAFMYPRRTKLQAMLDEVMAGNFNEHDVKWVIPAQKPGKKNEHWNLLKRDGEDTELRDAEESRDAEDSF